MSGFDDQNFLHLKHALEQFGYKQALGIETVPLVHAVFSDLLNLNQSYQQLKEQHDKQQQELSLATTQVLFSLPHLLCYCLVQISL